MKKMKQTLEYIKSRVSTLGTHVDYYETLERDKGYLTSDQEVSYNIALSQLRELDSLITFIEAGE